MFNEFETLEIDNSTGAGQTTVLTQNGVETIAVNSLSLLADFTTKRDSYPLGTPRSWSIKYSGITSGSGVLTLQMSLNGGIDWDDVTAEATGAVVEYTLTGTQTATMIAILEVGGAASYRWKFVDTDIAGADAEVVIYTNGGF